jgi:hypothetical protein
MAGCDPAKLIFQGKHKEKLFRAKCNTDNSTANL